MTSMMLEKLHEFVSVDSSGTKEDKTRGTGSGGDYHADFGVAEAPKPETLTDADRPHQGHRFFGVLCDMRRAVMFLDMTNFALVFLNLLLFLCFRLTIHVDGAHHGPSVGRELASAFPGLIMSGLGIYGAKQFKYHLVMLAAVYFGLEALFSVITFHFFGVIIKSTFIYAHTILAMEIEQGIMTEENYPKEEYSMCGV